LVELGKLSSELLVCSSCIWLADCWQPATYAESPEIALRICWVSKGKLLQNVVEESQ